MTYFELKVGKHSSLCIDLRDSVPQGVRGFYKGMGAPLVGVAPIFAVSFAGFNVGKRIQQNKPDDPLT